MIKDSSKVSIETLPIKDSSKVSIETLQIKDSSKAYLIQNRNDEDGVSPHELLVEEEGVSVFRKFEESWSGNWGSVQMRSEGK